MGRVGKDSCLEIYNYAEEFINQKECPICKNELEIYYGDSYFNIDNAEEGEDRLQCGNIVCKECGKGFNIIHTGEIYYISKEILKFGLCIGKDNSGILCKSMGLKGE